MFCVAATAMTFAPGASAQSLAGWDKKTRVTFSGPVEIPGTHVKGMDTLPAGTYTFRLLNSSTNRHIVQIQSEDQSKTYATILAIPNLRMKPTGDTVITFRERPAGQPPALRAWFYPGALSGDEFVYRKSKARDMAMTSNTGVLYSDDENSAEVDNIADLTPADTERYNNQTVSAYNDKGDDLAFSEAVTAPEPVQVAQNTEPPAMPAVRPATPEPSAEPSELPHTAGNIGILMLGGLLALGGAFGVRVIRQNS